MRCRLAVILIAVVAAAAAGWGGTPTPPDQPSASRDKSSDLSRPLAPYPVARLRVVLDDKYPPFSFRDDQGELQGILPDLWSLWSMRTGIPVSLIGTDWAEGQKMFNEGSADILDSVFKTDLREQIYRFSLPYASIPVSIVFDADLSGVKDATTLRGFTIGVKNGDACIDYLSVRGISSFRPYPSYEAVIEAESRGDIKVGCIDAPPAYYYLIRDQLEDRFRITPPLYHGEFHWVVRKGEDQLFDVVSQGFARITERERKQITERWMGQSPVGPLDRLWRRDVVTVLLAVAGIGLLMLFWVVTLRRQVRAQTAAVSSAVQSLRHSEKFFRTIFDAVNEAILILNAETGAVGRVNQRAIDVFGYDEAAVTALCLHDLCDDMPPYGREAFAALFRRVMIAPQRAEWLVHRRDGHPFWIEIDLRRIEIEPGFPQVLAVVRDISERKEGDEKLSRTIDALTRSNTDLERFAYAASHDLREPLNTLVRYAQLIEQRHRVRGDSDDLEFVAYIVDAAKQMMRLVEGLLEFSRVDAVGRGFDAVDAGDALSVALGYLSTAIAESGAVIRTGSMPVVSADEIQLVQLFQNLIGNALKYRDRSRVPVVTVSSRRQGDVWEFLVEDNGIGIDSDYLEQIFIIFKRLHAHSAIPGVGIGLALCKRIVERHGGIIWVESEPGKGTVFHFTLSPPSDRDES